MEKGQPFYSVGVISHKETNKQEKEKWNLACYTKTKSEWIADLCGKL